METIYWLLGYDDEEVEADERQKHLKHLACRQIEESKEIKLNKIENKIEYKNRFHNKRPEPIDTGKLTYELNRLNMNANKKRKKKSNK